MTRRTFPFTDRLMLGLSAILAGQGVRMTTPTDIQHRISQQASFLRCVWGMTVDAARFVDQRPVQFILTESLIDHLVVTSLAELEAIFFHRERIFSVRLVMTLVAHSVGNRLMNIIRQDRPGIRTVRIVTGAAAPLLHGVIPMCFFKATATGLVTLKAQPRLFCLK